jgi:hypothetical protein
MTRPKYRFLACFLASALLVFAAKKDRNWKMARIADSVTSGEGRAGRRAEVDAHVITIRDGDVTYILQEKPAWHDECLVVIGEPIQYVEDKNGMLIRDQQGTECKLAILHSQKQPEKHP